MPFPEDPHPEGSPDNLRLWLGLAAIVFVFMIIRAAL